MSDHLEVLYDIDIEAQKLAQELGIHLERTVIIEYGSSVYKGACRKCYHQLGDPIQ